MGFEYREDPKYSFDDQNESRADLVERALALSTDCNGQDDPDVGAGVFTDLSDLLANVRHFCDRAGISYGELDAHAHNAYLGDLGDNAVAKRDAERIPERKPKPVPEPGPGQIFIYSDGAVKTGPPEDPSA
jgi:hypothetical protein